MSATRACPNCGREMGFEDDGAGLTYLACAWCDLRTGIHRTEAECDVDLALGVVEAIGYGGGGNGDTYVHVMYREPGCL